MLSSVSVLASSGTASVKDVADRMVASHSVSHQAHAANILPLYLLDPCTAERSLVPTPPCQLPPPRLSGVLPREEVLLDGIFTAPRSGRSNLGRLWRCNDGVSLPSVSVLLLPGSSYHYEVRSRVSIGNSVPAPACGSVSSRHVAAQLAPIRVGRQAVSRRCMQSSSCARAAAPQAGTCWGTGIDSGRFRAPVPLGSSSITGQRIRIVAERRGRHRCILRRRPITLVRSHGHHQLAHTRTRSGPLWRERRLWPINLAMSDHRAERGDHRPVLPSNRSSACHPTRDTKEPPCLAMRRTLRMQAGSSLPT